MSKGKSRLFNFSRRVTPRKLKICLGIPCTGTVRVETLLSVVGILSQTPHDFFVDYRTGCYIEQNRTGLIQTAIREKCDKLFFLDADMRVEPQVVNKLLALNKPVVGADYHMRNKFPLTNNAKIADAEGNYIHVEPDDIPKVPYKAAAIPTGCMLLDIPTVQKIPHPWFDLTYFEDGTLEFGEDVFFCRKLIEHGVEVWCDPTIAITHVGTFEY